MKKAVVVIWGDNEYEISESLQEIQSDIYSKVTNRENPKQKKFTGSHDVDLEPRNCFGKWETRGYWEYNTVPNNDLENFISSGKKI
mgnify:CR=1 FL=1